MFRIVTDGAADMPPDWAETFEISVLPLNVNFGEEGYTQGPGFTNADFYRMVREKKIIPKTSLPSIGQIKAFYRSIAQAGDTILSIHISSRLSGTYSTVETAARELVGEFKIIAFDSLAGSAAQAFLAREARRMEQAGEALPDILARLESIRRRIAIVFTLDTLEYAYLSGRIGALQSLIAAALKVKPIIVLREGLLDIADRVRTRQRSIDHVMRRLQERFEDRLVNVAIVHAADPLTAQTILDRVKGLLNVKEAILTDLAIPVAANLGPGAIGVIGYTVEEERS
jgi:DegV family protein with EDD domain